jgi:hypothetical protein
VRGDVIFHGAQSGDQPCGPRLRELEAMVEGARVGLDPRMKAVNFCAD